MTVSDLLRRRLEREGWPAQAIREALDYRERFGHDGALLYPFLRRENGVRTPHGPATLLAVGSNGATVVHMREREKLDRGKRSERPVTRDVPIGKVRPA